MRPYRGRFAPSPTGRVHLGTARTALVAWLRARQVGGAFVLRNEDLDAPRVVPGAIEAILEDLRWLGLDWDEGPDVGGAHGPYVESERFDRYRDAIRDLDARGCLFRCTCTRKELASAASAPHGDEPLYPGTCRLGPSHPDRTPSLRFRLEVAPTFDDGLRGPCAPGGGDFVVVRADGVFSYQLAVAIDDRDMAVSEVVRGDDLVSSTPKQIAILRALRAAPPAYVHVPLVCDASGARLGKRHGSLARSLGLDVGPAVAAAELVTDFALERIPREPVRVPEEPGIAW
jgi:glutamyl-tRNA synthetase